MVHSSNGSPPKATSRATPFAFRRRRTRCTSANCRASERRGSNAVRTIDKFFLSTEPGQKRQVGIHRLSRLAPALHGDPANETETPVFLFAERLQRGRRIVHAR